MSFSHTFQFRTKRFVEMCSLEMSLLQNVNANDKVFIIVDTRHTQRWSERRVDPMLCKGDLVFFCYGHWKMCVSGHTSALLASNETWTTRKQSNLRTFSERSLKINMWLDVLRYVSQVQKRTKNEQRDHGTTDEVLVDQDIWNKEEMFWKKPFEKLTCSNRCVCLVTQNPRKHVWYLGFVFFAELALLSDDYIDIYDIYRKKHLCRCYVLPEFHKILSAPPRLSDARDATTQSRDFKHTKCLHFDLIFIHSETIGRPFLK